MRVRQGVAETIRLAVAHEGARTKGIQLEVKSIFTGPAVYHGLPGNTEPFRSAYVRAYTATMHLRRSEDPVVRDRGLRQTHAVFRCERERETNCMLAGRRLGYFNRAVELIGNRTQRKNGFPGGVRVESRAADKRIDGVKAMLERFCRIITDGQYEDTDEGGVNLANGEPAFICYNSAEMVVERFGGRVVGYYSDDNPSAVVGKDAGGHDFAIVFDEFIVDWWYQSFWGVHHDPVLHMARDAREVSRRYGDESKWEPVE